MDRKSIQRGNTNAGARAPERSFWVTHVSQDRESVKGGSRQSPRRSPNLEVLVNHGLTYSIPWQVRDLSLDGAFVEIESGPLPESSYIEMVLRYRYKDRPVELRLPATVARIDGQGMALRFGYYDDQTYTDLANLLYAR